MGYTLIYPHHHYHQPIIFLFRIHVIIFKTFHQNLSFQLSQKSFTQAVFCMCREYCDDLVNLSTTRNHLEMFLAFVRLGTIPFSTYNNIAASSQRTRNNEYTTDGRESSSYFTSNGGRRCKRNTIQERVSRLSLNTIQCYGSSYANQPYILESSAWCYNANNASLKVRKLSLC